MATAGTKMEASLWERLADGFGAFSEGIVGFLGRLFGSSNQRFIRSLGYIRNRDGSHTVVPGSSLAQVNDLEEHMKALSNDDLKALTPVFRERLAQGESLEDLLPEAFAAVRESSRRYLNMRHFDSQILGGIVLHRGNIAEMVTGEGKTLVATAPAYLNALDGQGVHIVTVNDYLARRDCEWMAPIFHGLGITCGYIQSDMDPLARRQAYDCDVTYGTNSEFGFDYLRDNMKPARWADPDYPPHLHQVQKALNYAIIDEVDNILIDEARTPLIISGMAFGDLKRYSRANEVAVQLSELQKKEPGKYFEVKEKEHTCHLTDEGIHKAEELAGVESFYTAGNMEWPHLIDNALKAHHLYHKDKQYVVMRHPESHEMSIIIVDEFTGRLMIGRQWSDGLHQAVEAKHAREGVKIKEETQTLATITLQNYFKLYNKLAGMTGTAMTEANEFWKIYKLDVIAIPTNQPLIRENYRDVIYLTEKEKWEAVVNEIERIHKWDVVRLKDGTELVGTIRNETDDSMEFVTREGERRHLTGPDVMDIERKGRPMLIGTTDVDKSEKLSNMLKRKGIKHELLNAKPEYAAREAEIVAQAGRIGAVTIATNMAGRGTDIILGGNPEPLAWGKLKDKYPTRLDVPPTEWKQLVDEIRAKEKMVEEGRKVAEMGGLHIVGTERHEARRIDNQLRGRAGRQGDPGSSRFYLSLDDDLMRIFAGEWVKSVLQRLGMEHGQSIESGMVSRRIQSAQKKREEHNFDIRKNLLEYDEVMDHQRKRVYGYRQEILEGANCKIRILKMIDEQIDLALDRFLDDDYGPASFAEHASKQLGVECDASDFTRSDFAEAEKTAREKAGRAIATQVHEAMETHLNPDADPTEWAWQALSNQVNSRWGFKTNEKDLKKIGLHREVTENGSRETLAEDELSQHITQLAEQSIAQVDLSKGAQYLRADWGIKSFCDWVKAKFQIALDPKSLAEKDRDDIRAIMRERLKNLYKQKEIEFPITVAMARFMSERHIPGTLGQRYDREGLYRWCRIRFFEHPRPGVPEVSEEDFRTQSRAKLHEILLDISAKYYPAVGHDEIDAKIAETFQGTAVSEGEDARELAEWVRETFAIEVSPDELTGISEEAARDILWTAFDKTFRPEMKRMERSLVLNQLDTSWKNHLYTMDHLRQGIGLMGYAQIDPKTEYKRQGMKEFDAMWEGVHDKVTDTVFRMEDDESFQESLWAISSLVHEAAPQFVPSREQREGLTNQQTDKKQEPIRNRKDRVGRNEPCPCGSGKKYKNCCMRLSV